MKIRTDFVTNSSSSSFVSVAVLSQDVVDFIAEILDGKGSVYGGSRVGGLEFKDDIAYAVTTLDWWIGSHICRQDEVDRRSKKQKAEDDDEANSPNYIFEVFQAFLPDLTEEQSDRLFALLVDAAEGDNTIASTYIDSTDSFEWPRYTPRDFIAKRFVLNQDGGVVDFNEVGRRAPSVTIYPGYRICAGAFRKCKITKTITIQPRVTLDEGAFSDCVSLEHLDLSGGCPVIPAQLCKNCVNLTAVTLPRYVDHIEAEAFAGCPNLTMINIPDTLFYIHESAFAGCDKLPQEVLDKVAALSDGVAFEKRFSDAISYICSNGDAKYAFEGPSFFDLFYRKESLDVWHAYFDQHFDYPETLERGKKIVYALYANKDVIVDMDAYGWKLQKSFSDKLDYLVVDTELIPGYTSFANKQKALASGYPSKTSSILEKAVDAKRSGAKIRIISKQHLEACIANHAFVEVEAENEPTKAKRSVNEDALAKATAKDAAKAAKQEEKARELEQLVIHLQEYCASTGKKFESMTALNEYLSGLGIKIDSHKRYIMQTFQLSPVEYFVKVGVIITAKMRFEEMLAVLAERYHTTGRKVKTVGEVEQENPDLDVAWITGNARAHSGLTAKELLIQHGILYGEDERKAEESPAGQPLDSDEIPEKLRKKMGALFVRLDSVYPSKLIIGLNKDHKKWAETASELAKALGYPDSRAFLEAYGYHFGNEEKGGRPKKDPMEVIDELKRRYPNGTEFSSVDELIAANPDIASRFQSLRNKSKEYFGMPFKQYLRSIGLIK